MAGRGKRLAGELHRIDYERWKPGTLREWGDL